MNSGKSKILAVDDEVFNLDILQTDLQDAGFDVICATDGESALTRVKEIPDIDIIVLDRMMPGMDGLQVTKTLKRDPRYKHIPVIMQTAAGENEQVREGIEAGVFYYLIKPYNEALLVSIVRNALRETSSNREVVKKVSSSFQILGLMQAAHFRFRTLKDIGNVAYYVANCCPNPDKVVYGLNELMINAVEHGNLDISYAEKMELVIQDRWQQEVERRLALPENVGKHAYLTFELAQNHIIITIKDQGKGFNWKQFLEFDPTRMASDPHGKGIAIARATSFPDLEFRAGGTEAVCRVPINIPQ